VQKAKESTARVVIWKELGITNSFTLEASFCGADQSKFADYHVNTDLLQKVRHLFCDTVLDFCDLDQVKVKAVREELEIKLPKASGGAPALTTRRAKAILTTLVMRRQKRKRIVQANNQQQPVVGSKQG